jgi:DNA-binding transcriptional ArsR family regulator
MPKKTPSRALSPEALERIAERFKVLSETVRLQLLIALEDGERNVSELVEATGKSQTNVSRQLQVLTHAGVLSRQKRGVSVYYRIVDPAIFDLCRHVCGSLQRQLEGQAETSKLFNL